MLQFSKGLLPSSESVAMATTKIATAIQSIPVKKESLRKAFEVLQTYSSSLASFPLDWKDIDAHFSTIEKAIDEDFKNLECKEVQKFSSAEPEPEPETEPETEPEPESFQRPELLDLCAKMDGKGLRTFISDNGKESNVILFELSPALRSAPDSSLLVLDAIEDVFSSKPPARDKNRSIRRACFILLERLRAIAPEIKPAVRERAKKLATDWRVNMLDDGWGRDRDNSPETVGGFLHLLLSYGLVSECKGDDLLDLLVIASKRKDFINLCKDFGITANKAPDLIQKLSNVGKQPDAVKIIYAFNLLDKFPPAILLEDYVKETETAQEVTKGNNSHRSWKISAGGEIGALKSLLKFLEEDYEIESERTQEIVRKRIAVVQQQKNTKYDAKKWTAVSNSKAQQQHRPNKRPRPSTTLAPAVTAHPLSTPYMGLAGAGSYGLAMTGYSHAGPNPMGLGGNRLSPSSYLYPSEPFAGASGLYDGRGSYSGYSVPSHSSFQYP